jgi:hypothetical protein
MNEFLVADLNVRGELEFREFYSYEILEHVPGAVDLIARSSAAIWREPALFEIPLSTLPSPNTLRWAASAESSGIASVRHNGALMSLSLLASGLDSDADTITLNAFQSHLLRELHDTGFEPAFDLTNLAERPLVATINFHSPTMRADQEIVALADRCFAAAYFRYHKLV